MFFNIKWFNIRFFAIHWILNTEGDKGTLVCIRLSYALLLLEPIYGMICSFLLLCRRLEFWIRNINL